MIYLNKDCKRINKSSDQEIAYTEDKHAVRAEIKPYNQKYVDRAYEMYEGKDANPIGEGKNNEIKAYEGFDFKYDDYKKTWSHNSKHYDIVVTSVTDIGNLSTWLSSFKKEPSLIANRGIKSHITKTPEPSTLQEIIDIENSGKLTFYIGTPNNPDAIAECLFRANTIQFPRFKQNFIKSVALCEANPQLTHQNIILHEMAHILATLLPKEKRQIKSSLRTCRIFLKENFYLFSPHYLELAVDEWESGVETLEKMQKRGETLFETVYDNEGSIIYSGSYGSKESLSNQTQHVNLSEKIDDLYSYMADEIIAEAITHYLFGNLNNGLVEMPEMPSKLRYLGEMCENLYSEAILFKQANLECFPIPGRHVHRWHEGLS